MSYYFGDDAVEEVVDDELLAHASLFESFLPTLVSLSRRIASTDATERSGLLLCSVVPRKSGSLFRSLVWLR